MANKSSTYWQERFEILEKASNSYGVDAYRRIEPAFDKAQREIQGEIEKWYARYAKNNEIDIVESRKHLTSSELKELKWDVNEYIKYGRENQFNQQWIKELENASAKFHINRLEALKLRTQQSIEVAFGNELDEIDKMARKVFSEDYYHSIFEVQKGFNLGWEIGQIDERKLDKIIAKPWTTDNRTFKDRIWNTKNQMVNELHQQLTRTTLLGKSPDKAIESLSKYVKKDIKNKKYVAGRLVMTEQAYFHSVAQREAFNDLDVEEYEIVATLDSHTSEICQDMDGEHFPMKDYEPGVNAPPFHVFCRSVTVPYFNDEFSLGERAARGADGKTYYVPSDMKYKDWKKSMVDGQTDGLEYMSLSNKSRLGYTKPIKHSPEELQELVSYANEKGIKVFQIQKFDGDSELLKEQIDVLSELKNEYNHSRKLTISFADLGRTDLAVTSKKGKSIRFNNLALRSREMTNAYLNADDFLSSTDIKGIAAHEMGHVLQKAYGNKGLDIVQKACYNLNGKNLQYKDVVGYLINDVSKYSTERDKRYDGKLARSEQFKEIIPEILGKHFTNPDEFTTEFVKLLKEEWEI